MRTPLLFWIQIDIADFDFHPAPHASEKSSHREKRTLFNSENSLGEGGARRVRHLNSRGKEQRVAKTT